MTEEIQSDRYPYTYLSMHHKQTTTLYVPRKFCSDIQPRTVGIFETCSNNQQAAGSKGQLK
jgi:hypothetical protein